MSPRTVTAQKGSVPIARYEARSDSSAGGEGLDVPRGTFPGGLTGASAMLFRVVGKDGTSTGRGAASRDCSACGASDVQAIGRPSSRSAAHLTLYTSRLATLSALS